jgi:dihydropteroate synthase
LRSRKLTLGPRTLLMGILNVTPDSFSDGGRFFQPEAAVEQALRLLAEGADILDIGGESTRPGVAVSPADGSGPAGVSANEELRRVLPVIEAVRRAAPEAVISVDTYKAAVAREAVAAGAEIVNDVSALRWDAEMLRTLAQSDCGVVLMHTRGRPEEWRTLPRLGEATVKLVVTELSERAAAAERGGIARERIVVDPGFGFGKSFEDNYPLLARLDELQQLGYPLLAGTSRKAFIGRSLSRSAAPVPPAERLYGTLGTVAAAILKGAHIVRVHDVAAARDTAAICDEILRAENSQ